MTKKERRNEALQALCREYLGRLKGVAKRYGLERFVSDTIKANKNKTCKGTEHECELLARMVNEERVSRVDVPKILGKSYRQANEEEDFDKVRKLPHVGIYSKVSTLLLASEKNA